MKLNFHLFHKQPQQSMHVSHDSSISYVKNLPNPSTQTKKSSQSREKTIYLFFKYTFSSCWLGSNVVYIIQIGIIINRKREQRQVRSSKSRKSGREKDHMAAKTSTILMPIISKLHCSSSQTVLVVRRRPHAVNGGGFVVTDCSTQKVAFRVDGCGVLGKKGELILREGDGDALLVMRRKVYHILLSY